eukprot:TRINITY_DN10083_c0_g3_i1.p1 TRINITY_DN10083_c0_g3~~TRINITY_DN10083_c0_g3_i1.p1  ORF type:complete len:170 (-),score=18.94 TRINITY_DN10083_c0_g3_i1:147-656(-)
MAGQNDFDVQSLSSTTLNLLLFRHILMKGVEVGSFLGLVLVAPIVYLRSQKPINPIAIGRALTISAYTGPLLTGALGLGKRLQINREGLEDRVYRLNYNEEQNRWDLFSTCGILGGAALATLRFGYQPWLIAGGGVVGCSVGTIAHLSTWKKRKDIGKQMLEELKSSTD